MNLNHHFLDLPFCSVPSFQNHKKADKRKNRAAQVIERESTELRCCRQEKVLNIRAQSMIRNNGKIKRKCREKKWRLEREKERGVEEEPTCKTEKGATEYLKP